MKKGLCIIVLLLAVCLIAGCTASTSTTPLNNNSFTENNNTESLQKAVVTGDSIGWSGIVQSAKSALLNGWQNAIDLGLSAAQEKESAPASQTDKSVSITKAASILSSKHVHKYKKISTTKSTCAKQGVEKYKCSCGKTYTKKLSLASHKYKKTKTIKSTCIKQGSETYKCSVCGKTYTKKLALKDHTYVKSKVVKPTETSEGYTLYKCSVCGKTKKTDITAKLPHKHSYTAVITKEASCGIEGLKTYTCKCGDSYTEVIKATHHSYVGKIVPPTKDAEGYTLYTCKYCGRTYTRNPIPPYDPATAPPFNNPDYPFTSIAEMGEAARSKMLNFTNEGGDASYDFYFKMGINLKNDISSYDLSKEFWKVVDRYTGKPEEGDTLYGQYRLKGCTISSSKWENGRFCYIVAIYGRLFYNKTELTELKNSLDVGAKGTDYQKALKVFQWVVKNCTYGEYTKNGRFIYNTAWAARFKTATCNGISRLVYDMMLHAGVECRIVHSSEHAWNIVKIDGKWYIVDATFALSHKSGGVGENSYAVKHYFLIGSNNYSRYSTRDKTVLGGNISVSKTNYK